MQTPVLEQNWQDKPNSTRSEIYYPASDGKPVGETDWHIAVILYLRQALHFLFRNVGDVYTAADMLFYYEEGEPKVFKVPDIFVVRGVAKHERRIYKLWEEKVIPCVIFEVTSRSTRWEDIGEKKALYEFLGIREYFLFDPLDEYLKPRLQGFRLRNGQYIPIPREKDGTLISQELGIILRPEGTLLLVVDPKNGETVPSLEESNDKRIEALKRAEAEAQRAEAEAQRADTAEAALARVLIELEQLKRQQTDQQS